MPGAGAESFFLFLHFICAVFFFITEILPTGNPSALEIFCFILYLILIILPAIFKSRKVKLLFYMMLLAGNWLASLFYPYALCFFPLPVTRVMALFTLPVAAELAFYALPVAAVTDSNKLLYCFSAALAFLILRTIAGYEKKAVERELKIDNLEHENQDMNRQLNRLQELEKDKELFYKLEERNRIIQKLHDELGHSLTGSIVQLEAVNTIIRKDPGKAELMISNVSNVLNNSMHGIRQGLKSLKPANSELALQNIKTLLGDFEKNSSIRTHLKTEGNVYNIPLLLWQIITMNLKEALTNILKHSRAGEVNIELLVLNKIIKVGIRDNGLGTIQFVPGMGLTGMEERTRDAGGTLILDGTDGFSVIMVFRKDYQEGVLNGDQGFNRR